MVERIILKLQGGMGNQMFQYALGRSLQEKYDAELVLDTSDFQYDRVGRQYALDVFNLNFDRIHVDNSGSFNWKYDERKNYFIKAAVKIIPEILFRLGCTQGKYIWESTDYVELPEIENHRSVFVHGYWQSEKYFDAIKDSIKKELTLKRSIVNKYSECIDKFRNEESVAIHLRRSDYLKNNNQNHVLPINYYYNAMDYMDRTHTNVKYYIFSDDISWVKDNINIQGRDISFIEGEYKDYEEFLLMYSCKHFIIANSTFSWWGSYIGMREGSCVIAPSIWYDDGRDISSLLREEFILIEEC